MGFSCRWLAVREETAPRLLEQFGYVVTDQAEEVPESAVCSATLSNGWRVIYFNTYMDFPERELRQLSADRELIYCVIVDAVGGYMCARWLNGKQTFLIYHDASIGVKEYRGELPACFSRIRAAMEALQEEAGDCVDSIDYLGEIPIRVAQELTGFRHDEESPLIPFFEVLAEIPKPKGFLARLFS